MKDRDVVEADAGAGEVKDAARDLLSLGLRVGGGERCGYEIARGRYVGSLAGGRAGFAAEPTDGAARVGEVLIIRREGDEVYLGDARGLADQRRWRRVRS